MKKLGLRTGNRKNPEKHHESFFAPLKDNSF